MKAAVWYGKKDIRIEEVAEKPVKDNQVKVTRGMGRYLRKRLTRI